jgi:hypothetical protein
MDTEAEAWAVVVQHLLRCVPQEKRRAVLAKAAEWERAEQEEIEKADEGVVLVWADSIDFQKSPGFKHWHKVMEYKSRVIFQFTRSISNNHSPKDAAKILFADRHGCLGVGGSGRLRDYLDGLQKGSPR